MGDVVWLEIQAATRSYLQQHMTETQQQPKRCSQVKQVHRLDSQTWEFYYTGLPKHKQLPVGPFRTQHLVHKQFVLRSKLSCSKTCCLHRRFSLSKTGMNNTMQLLACMHVLACCCCSRVSISSKHRIVHDILSNGADHLGIRVLTALTQAVAAPHSG